MADQLTQPRPDTVQSPPARARGVMHPVTIRATKDNSGNYHFAPESELWDPSRTELVFKKDRHGMRKQDYHLVEFVLNDETGDGLKFPKVPHEAMWVMEGAGKCPDMHSVSNYDVMEPICVCGDRDRLIVRNDNPRREDWAFTLNFVKRGESDAERSRYVNWDPVGANHNGGV